MAWRPFSPFFLLYWKGGEFFIAAFPKRGVKRGVLPVVYLFLLVFFMGVILADSVSAAKLVGSLDQSSIDGGTFGLSGVSQYKSIARAFTTGSNSQGYLLTDVKIAIKTGASSRTPVAGIYTNNAGSPGSKVYDLSGDVSSSGNREFTAPPGATLSASTTYFFFFAEGGGSGRFQLSSTRSTGIDSNPSTGWSMADHSRYTRRNGGIVNTNGGGLRMGVFGVARSSNSVATGKPSITGTVQIDSPLLVDTNSIFDSNGLPGSFTYQWVRVDGGTETDISGATGSTYTPVAADFGKRLKVRVGFIDGHAYRESVVSDVSGVVRDSFGNAPATGKPVIRGVVAVGESLFADVSGVRDLNGVPSSFVYQWVRVDGGVEEDISGATLAIYNVVSVDEGKLLKVKVSFIDGEGYSEGPLASDSTGAVLDAAPSVSHGTKLPGTLSITSIPNQLSAFGSIWSDGITLYALDFLSTGRHIYAYTLSNGSRDRAKEFSNVGTIYTTAIWSDGETMWVGDTSAIGTAKLFAYNMSDKSRDSGKDFNTLGPAGNSHPTGMWSDGVTMWVTDFTEDKLYAYRMSDKSRDSGKDFNTLNAAGNENTVGIWSDGVTMWVGDSGDAYVYAYRMSDKSRDSGKDLNLTSSFSGSLTGPGFGGHAMLITGGLRIHFYAIDSPVYKLPRWSEDSGKDCGGGVSTGCSVDVNGYGVGVIDPAADVDWWSLEFEGGKTYAIDVKGAGDQSGNDNAGTLPDPVVSLYSHFGESPLLANINDNVNDGQNNNSRIVYSVGLDAGGTYYVSVAKASSSSEGGTYTVLVRDLNRVLVSNINQSVVGYHIIEHKYDISQEFTTGNHSNGYNVSHIVLNISEASSLFVPVVSIYSSDGTGSRPVTKLYEFSGSVNATGHRNFTAPVGGTNLSPNTKYFVDVGGYGNGLIRVTYGSTSYALDSGSLPGWNISDKRLYSTDNRANWVSSPQSGPLHFSIFGLPRLVSVPVASNPPAFSSSSTFLVSENVRSVGTVVASDDDGKDSVTGYRISGGADRLLFSITSPGGVLTFNYVPDFESPVDTGGDNVYDLVLEATSGTGSRVRTAIQSIAVTVTDVVEVPSVPSAPVLSSPSSTSLLVSWSAPGNTGPAIDDYDVQYRQGTSGSFSNWSHSGTGTSTTITGLNVSTLYQVRVRARSDEGVSGWSGTSSSVVVGFVNVVSSVDRVLVSNINQSSYEYGYPVNNVSVIAHEFITGNNSNGYDVSSIVVDIYSGSSEVVPVVSIYSSNDSQPVTKLYEFSGSVNATGHRNFTAPVGGTNLSPNTRYVVHITANGSGSFITRYSAVDSDVVDSSSLSDWNLSRVFFTYDAGLVWASDTFLSPLFSILGSVRSDSDVTVSAINNFPAFSSGSSFSVNENSRNVGTVVASDPDSQDSVTGYNVSGGVDSARFSITNGGVLSFVSVPNYENPQDNGTDNVYALEVEVTSGAGSRVRTAVQTITVTVVDVDEAPSAPGSPVLSSPSSTSLLVSWSAPGGTGPSIIDYDVGYGLNSNGPFTDWPHSDASRSAVITDLSVGTLYYVRVLARNAEGASGWSEVSNFTTRSASPPPVTNGPPVFTSDAAFSVNENSRNVGTVVASDSDSQDSVTGYTISGGVDSGRFSITSGGVLTFRSAPDFESPSDNGGNNVYNIVVTATSGTGSRVRTATQSIAVTVTDVVEVPSVPSAPVLSSPSSTSLLVSWSAPGNTGPAIDDYDVQYRQGTSGSFSNWSHSGTGTSTTITGLNVSTLYQVRVLARNDEGVSGWSSASSFTTGSAPVNTLPAFTSSSTFLVQENSRSVGVIVASDHDTQDSVTGYDLSGGVDRLLFSITSPGGVLTFNSVPDYESPVDSGGDNVYDLVVTVTSGTGSRVRTAIQSVTVTVTDVVEVPSVPSAPVLSSPSSTSLLVSWSAPGNTGPAIDDYDVQYRQGTSGSFSNWLHSGAGTSTTITPLNPNTLYQVQVLARSDEGDSNWSSASSFTTGSTVTNNLPSFTSSSTFLVQENSRSVGVVVASDHDTQDSVTGYDLSGGVDRLLFSITSPGGVLTFNSVPDFESPVDNGGDNVYSLVVTATSGTGSRVRTATQSIKITVNDVDEGGPVILPREVVLVYSCG